MGESMDLDLAEDLGEEARRLAIGMRRVQRRPHRGKWVAEIAE